MSNIITEDEPSQEPKALDLKLKLFELCGEISKPELSIGYALIDILYETELPKEGFPLTKVTSTSNENVVEKAKLLESIPGLTPFLIPLQMQTREPIDLTDKKTQEEWQGINFIHAWMTTLSYMNTISNMQKMEPWDAFEAMFPRPEEVIAAMMHELWCHTTEGNNKKFLRNSENFENHKKTVETFMRESGTEGVNPTRHVSYAEMMYILNTIKEIYLKK